LLESKYEARRFKQNTSDEFKQPQVAGAVLYRGSTWSGEVVGSFENEAFDDAHQNSNSVPALSAPAPANQESRL